jgi:phosphatidylserine decarboxylase
MSKPTPLTVFDRRSDQTFEEFLDDSPATYESKPSASRDQWLKASPLYDWFAAAWQNTPWSARKIGPFVRKHWIDMSEFEPGPFRSYAAFFDRRFLPGKRSFPADRDRMGAFGEGRYFGWEELKPGMTFPVKGAALEPKAILEARTPSDTLKAALSFSRGCRPLIITIYTFRTMDGSSMKHGWVTPYGR